MTLVVFQGKKESLEESILTGMYDIVMLKNITQKTYTITAYLQLMLIKCTFCITYFEFLHTRMHACNHIRAHAHTCTQKQSLKFYLDLAKEIIISIYLFKKKH